MVAILLWRPESLEGMVMKLRTFVSVLGLAVLLLSTATFANGNGDVTIKVNPAYDGHAWLGQVNVIEIWITNDAPLYGMSIGLKFDCPGIPLSLYTPYGNVPKGGPYKYVQEWGDAYGAFDPDNLQITVDALSNTILIRGTASSSPLPAHAGSTKCYDLRLHIPCGGELSGQLSIDNVYLAPDGPWMFDDGTPYAPTFHGQPNTSMTIPDASAEIFEVHVLPCGYPRFTNTPNAVENASHCSEFKFTFRAEDPEGKCGKGPLEFSSSVGNMNPTTGQFTLLPDPACGVTAVTAIVTNSGCMTDQFVFTVNWIDTPAEFTNCPILTGYIKADDIYEFPFAAHDPDTCDKITYTVVPFGGPPVGSYAVNSTGKFVFTPAPDDNEYLRVFNLFANSGCSAIDTCQFRVMIGWSVCGDANGDMEADISDVVYLISYIFQGGLQPNPLLKGDANCDAAVDISDVVYLISYIFSGGYLPCADCP
jgi:hypothetical protein